MAATEKRRDPLTMSNEHINHMRRFAGLPQLDAKRDGDVAWPSALDAGAVWFSPASQ
jgi:hypothetical protein